MGQRFQAKLLWAELIGTEELETMTVNPRDPFMFQVTLGLGLVGNEGSELYNLEVCNPLYLEKLCIESSMVTGAWRAIIRNFDATIFIEDLRRAIARCTGITPKEALNNVGKLAMSQFETFLNGVRPTFL